MGAFCVAGVSPSPRERPRTRSRSRRRRAVSTSCAAAPLQAFLVANALWELALSALKTFVVLYVTKTLGLSLAGSSLASAPRVVVLVGALVSGKLGDRVGRARVMRARCLYGLGLLVPFATTAPWLVALAAPLVAFGGGVTMSLPYALLMPMMPAARTAPSPACTRSAAGWARRWAAAGRRRHPGGRRGLPLDVARCAAGDPRLDPGRWPAARRPLVPTDCQSANRISGS
jgi:hypothetical protein